jgi:hypothetical protein
MSLIRVIGWTLGAAVGIPLAPFALVYNCLFQKSYSSGNGASAWFNFADFIAGVFGSLALAGLVAVALVNPVVAGCIYAAICLAVGLKMGM